MSVCQCFFDVHGYAAARYGLFLVFGVECEFKMSTVGHKLVGEIPHNAKQMVFSLAAFVGRNSMHTTMFDCNDCNLK